MKFDLHFPAMPVKMNLIHTEQMNKRPKESQINVRLFIPEFPQIERASISCAPSHVPAPGPHHGAHTLTPSLGHLIGGLSTSL